VATYDWRAQEARLNELAHFRTVYGQWIHFVHIRSTRRPFRSPAARMAGSIIEFLDVIPLLRDD
jgi:hypothetical protein